MIRNDEIQSTLITKTKANATIVALLVAPSSIDEIREDQWQGNTFVYPHIRIRMISNKPVDDCKQDITVSFMAFTEDSYSDTADKIAGIIAGEYDDKPFIASGLQISLTITDILPAFRSDVRTWRAEAIFRGTVSKAS